LITLIGFDVFIIYTLHVSGILSPIFRSVTTHTLGLKF
jgi:hypothetical protein